MSMYRKLAYSTLITAGFLFIIVPVIALAIMSSTTLSQWVVNSSRAVLPESIAFEKFSGKLAGPFTLHQVNYQSAAFSADVSRIVIDWSPWQLFSGQLYIDQVAIGKGEFRTRAVESTRTNDSSTDITELDTELPLSITLVDLSLAESWVFIHDAPQQQFALSTSLAISETGKLDINSLHIDHQYATLETAGSVQLSYPLNYSLTSMAELHSPDYPTTRLELSSSGNLEKLNATLKTSKSAAVDIEANASSLVTSPEWQARITFSETNVDSWLAAFNVAGLPSLTLDGVVDAGSAADSVMSISPDLRLIQPALESHVVGDIRLSEHAIDIQSLTATLSGIASGAFEMSGDVKLDTEPSVNLDVQAKQIAYQRVTTSGSVTLDGLVSELSLTADTTSEFNDRSLAMNLTAMLTPSRLSIEQLSLSENSSSEGRVEGTASADWSDDLVITSDVQGRLFDQPLTLLADVRYSAPYVTVNRLDLNWQDSSISASGVMAPGRQLNISAEIPKLSDFPLPMNVSGSLSMEAELEGDLTSPWVDATLKTQQLNLAGTQLQSLTIDLNGDLSSQQIALTSSALATEWVLEASSQWSDSTVDITLTKLIADHESLETISLKQRANAFYDWNTNQIRLANFCLTQSQPGEPVCINVATEQQLTTINVNAPATELAVLNPFLANSSVRLQGSASVKAKTVWAWNKNRLVELKGSIEANETTLEGMQESVLIDSVTLDIVPQEKQTQVTMSALSNDVGLDVKGHLKIAELVPTSAIEGKLTASLSNLTLLQLLAPSIAQADGDLSASIDIAGSLPTLKISPAAEADIRELVLAETGTLINDSNVSLRATDDSNTVFKLVSSGLIGDGDYNLEGSYDVPNQTLQAKLNGKQLQVLDTPKLSVRVSPSIEVTFADRKLTIAGDVIVPDARITPPQLTDVVRPSSDVVIKQEQREKQAAIETDANITVTLGDNVNVAAYGFEGQLEGKLNIAQKTNSVARGNGQIGVKAGTYEVYGQELSIERGQLIYNGGPLENPGLNLQVIRKLPEATANPDRVGARVEGTLQEPTLSLFSEPPMPDASVLSYLLFGRAPNSQSESSNLELQAALLLTGDMADAFTQSLKDTFGFDEVSIDSNTDNVNDTSLYIGKYLTPRLYIKYGIGLVESTSSFFLRYQLTDHFWFESSSSTESQSGDLIYSIEK